MARTPAWKVLLKARKEAQRMLRTGGYMNGKKVMSVPTGKRVRFDLPGVKPLPAPKKTKIKMDYSPSYLKSTSKYKIK